jgi:hypothetical protein
LRLIIVLLFAFPVAAQLNVSFPGPGPIHVAASATPGFVNETSQNSTLTNVIGNNPTGQTICTNFSYCAPFADTALSGNLGIIAGHFANSTTLTPTASDDKSDSFTCTTGGSKDSGTNEWPYLCYFANLTSGAHNTTTTFGSTAATQITEKVAQFYNIATSSPLDGSIGSCAGASGTTANCASVSPTQVNDLIYVLVCRAGTPAATSFTAGSGFTLITEDIRDGCASEWEVDTGTGSITPTMTLNPASTYVEIVAAFKSATAGTAPSGLYVDRMMSAFTGYVHAAGTFNFQFTSTGNMLLKTSSCGSMVPGTPSDSVNTWTLIGTTTDSAVVLSEAYVPSALANTTGLISETTTVTGDCNWLFYDFTGAPSSPIVSREVIANNTGNTGATLLLQNDTANTPDATSTGSSWLPDPTNGLVMLVHGQGFNTVTSVSTPSSGCPFDAGSYGGENLSGPGGSTNPVIGNNNLWAHCYFSAGAQPWFVVNESSSTVATSAWAVDLVGVFGTGIGIKQWTENFGTSSASLALTQLKTITSGNLLVAAIDNSGGTVTKVCLDGTTCGAGNSFTQMTGAVSTGSGHGATDIWYLLSAPSGKTTATITFSASQSNVQATFTEVQKGSGSWATDGNATHVTNGTGSSNTDTGSSVTTTGSADYCTAIISVSNGVTAAPKSGNEFTYGNVIFANTSDAASALLTTSATTHTPTWTDSAAAGGFSSSTGCWK